MISHYLKLATLLVGIAVANASFAEEVPAITLGYEPIHGPGKKIVIHLLSPLNVHGNHLGGNLSADGNDVGIERVSAGDHGFLFTSESDLFIDNLYAGRFSASDDLWFCYNRLWLNGNPCVFSKISKMQEKIVYGEQDIVKEDGSCQIEELPYKIFVKPVSGDGGRSFSNGVLVIREGMYVLRIESEVLHLNGIPFGKVDHGSEIRIMDGRVLVNGTVRLPQSEQSKKAIEAGADQPATKPADKVPAKIQPSTPTSKDSPRQ
jgi:hypothetical protein